jgi:DMSO/TMAO reductase YedYZ molybdopterin-dependent catalytic subunit
MRALVIEGPAARARVELEWRDVDALAAGDALVEHTERLSAKVRGEGVRLAAVLARALGDGATHVVVHGGGDYRACLALETIATAVLAHRSEGAPLPESLGGPLRLLVPSSDNACLSVKGVNRIIVTDHAEPDTVPKPVTPLRSI